MQTLFLLLAAACGAAAARGDGLVTIGAGLRGPAGLRATVYATGLPHASAFALDSRGRLWVTTAAYSPDRSDGVYVVESPGATPVQVVSGLRTPLGLLWVRDTLYVASAGRVDAYGGFAGTAFTSDRQVLTWPSSVGETNNIAMAPDGRLLVGISAPCDHCTPAAAWSASIVSLRPDGSDARTYATGIRAPFGLAYYPGTGDLFVTMDQRDDLGVRTPGDWLAVVRQGQDWRSPACYGQGGAACAGVPAPVAVLDPHAGVGRMAIVTGRLGTAAGTSALVAEWAKGKVQRVALTRSGSGYRGSVSPFLTGIANPLPLLTTGDGALLAGDWTTGTVYRIASES